MAIILLAGSPLAFLAILDIVAGALSLSSGILLILESMGLKGDIAAGLAFASSAILVREKYQSILFLRLFCFVDDLCSFQHLLLVLLL